MKMAKLPLFETYVGARQNNGTGAKFQATKTFSSPITSEVLRRRTVFRVL